MLGLTDARAISANRQLVLLEIDFKIRP